MEAGSSTEMEDRRSHYVREVVDFSSQYGSDTSISYTMPNLVGHCNVYPNYGDFTQAAVFRTYGPWWNMAPSAVPRLRRMPNSFRSQDFVELLFARKVYPRSIHIFETYYPGAVVRILACDVSPLDASFAKNKPRWYVLWAGPPEMVAPQSRDFNPDIRPNCPFPTNLIRLEFNQDLCSYYTEIDAVKLIGSTSSSVDGPEIIGDFFHSTNREISSAVDLLPNISLPLVSVSAAAASIDNIDDNSKTWTVDGVNTSTAVDNVTLSAFSCSDNGVDSRFSNEYSASSCTLCTDEVNAATGSLPAAVATDDISSDSTDGLSSFQATNSKYCAAHTALASLAGSVVSNNMGSKPTDGASKAQSCGASNPPSCGACSAPFCGADKALSCPADITPCGAAGCAISGAEVLEEASVCTHVDCADMSMDCCSTETSHSTVSHGDNKCANEHPEDFQSLSNPSSHFNSINGYFDMLPVEIIQLILSFLDLSTLCRLSAVSRLFNHHCYDPVQYTEVDLQPYWDKISDSSLIGLESRCVRVQKLSLSWCGGYGSITPKVAVRFIRICAKSLTCLRLASCRFVDDIMLDRITEECCHLSELDLRCCRRIYSSAFCQISALVNLQRLNLYRTNCDTVSLLSISRCCKKLEHLNLGACTAVRDYDDVAISIGENCRKLISLDLWRAKGLSDVGLRAIATGCPLLEELDLGWCPDLKSSTNCFIDLAKSCRRLKKLFLAANRTVCDEDLEAISTHCSGLEQLDILGTREIHSAVLHRVLERCRGLKFFDVSFCEAADMDTVIQWQHCYPHCDIKRSFQADRTQQPVIT